MFPKCYICSQSCILNVCSYTNIFNTIILNIQVIDIYCSLVSLKSNVQSPNTVYILSCFFYQKLCKSGYEMVSKWVKVIHKSNSVEWCVISYAKLGRCHVLSKDNYTSDYGGTLEAHCGGHSQKGNQELRFHVTR